MYLVGVSTINNEERRWCPATSISHLLFAAPVPEPTLEEPLNPDNDVQQADLKILSRSGISFTREELSYQVSSTAGDRTPGPLDAPCLVETSTAHDGLLLWAMIFLTGITKLSWISSSSSDLFQNSQTPTLTLSEMSGSPENITITYVRRHAQTSPWQPNVRLGFHLLDFPKCGPLSLLKPKYKRGDPTQLLLKPRSDPKLSLSIDNLTLCRLLEHIERGHQLLLLSPLLIWLYKNFMRTWPLESPRVFCHESKSLKMNGIMCSILRSGWCHHCHRSFGNYVSTTPLDTQFKQLITSNNNRKAQTFWSFQKACENPLLLPSQNSTMEVSSTSLSLLTVTISSSNASSVDELSTYRGITCVKLLHSFGLQALMEPLSNSLIYPFVALENASLCLVLNFEISVLSSLNLV